MIENAMLKRCPTCEGRFPRTSEYFHRRANRGDGWNEYCKKCLLASRKRNYVPHPRVIPTSRICGRCKIDLPLTSEFFYPHKIDKAGFRHRCKKCGDALRKEWLCNNPGKRNAARIKNEFGLDAFAHSALLASQDGGCAVCKRKESEFKRRLAVDHDHKTGKVRGLLCSPCNTALGLANDDPEILTMLADYLRRRSGPVAQ